MSTNAAVSKWYSQWSPRLEGALCRDRPDLPWTPDEAPEVTEFLAMRDVCLNCPVRIACANCALDRKVPAQGGMYAGVWLPWRTYNGRPGRGTSPWHVACNMLRRAKNEWETDELQSFIVNRNREEIHV